MNKNNKGGQTRARARTRTENPYRQTRTHACTKTPLQTHTHARTHTHTNTMYYFLDTCSLANHTANHCCFFIIIIVRISLFRKENKTMKKVNNLEIFQKEREQQDYREAACVSDLSICPRYPPAFKMSSVRTGSATAVLKCKYSIYLIF